MGRFPKFMGKNRGFNGKMESSGVYGRKLGFMVENWGLWLKIAVLVENSGFY